MFQTITACALYLMSARADCTADYKTAIASCLYDAAFYIDYGWDRGDTELEYIACRQDARDELKQCYKEATVYACP